MMPVSDWGVATVLSYDENDSCDNLLLGRWVSAYFKGMHKWFP
jgi:hypothetical protein